MKILCRIAAALLALLALGVAAAAAETDVLYLPEGTKVIDEEAFYGAASLERVVVPEGAKRIEGFAFARSGLTDVELPGTLEYIADTAFDESALVRVYAEAGTRAYDWAQGKGYTVVTRNAPGDFEHEIIDGECVITGYRGAGVDVWVPGTIDGYPVTGIGDEAFKDNAELKSVRLSDGVRRVGNWAFGNCDALESAVVPDSVAEIGDDAFYQCKSLRGFRFPASLTKIGEYAFGYSGLTDVRLPAGLTEIGGFVFFWNADLTEVHFPAGLTTIGEGMFHFCENLEEVSIPEGVTVIGNWAFGYCTRLKRISLPDSLNTIEEAAFYECPLTEVSIPDGVSSIGGGAFGSCKGLTAIDVGEANASYCSVDGVLFDKARTTLVCCPAGLKGRYAIPAGVTAIGSFAFNGCADLTEIAIPDGVATIGYVAFCGCDSLAEIAIPASVTTIQDNAFNNPCPQRLYVEAGSYAQTWAQGKGYTVVTRNAPDDFETEIVDGECVVTGYRGTSVDVWLPETIGGYPVTGIGTDAFRENAALKSVRIPTGVTRIQDNAFYICSGLERLALPDGLTHIGARAFYKCAALESVRLPDTLTEIGLWAFGYCHGLTAVDIPDSVTAIGLPAFGYCFGLKSINVGEDNANYTSVDGALYDKSGKTLLCYPAGLEGACVIPEGVTAVERYAFGGCEALTGIRLPVGVKRIGEFAFRHCSALGTVEMPNTVNDIADTAFEDTNRPTVCAEEGSYAYSWAVNRNYNVVTPD